MNPAHEPPWRPDPDVWSSYLSGKLTDRAMTQRIERWLEENPAALDEASLDRSLRDLCELTPAPPPSLHEWNVAWQKIQTRVPPTPWWQPVVWFAGLAACVAFFALFRSEPSLLEEKPKPAEAVANHPAPEEVFAVASPDEIQILRVEGSLFSLAVGELPLAGLLELLETHEFTVRSIEPDARDQMVPHVVSGTPMIWAKLVSEE